MTSAQRVILVAAAMLGIATGAGSTIAFSLGTLIPHLITAHGWSRGDISLAMTVMTVGIFLTGPLAGRLADRYGAAPVATISMISYALLVTLLALSATSIEIFWGFHLAIAMIGAGSTPIVLLRPIAASFDARRGLAMGLALTGGGLAAFWIPITLQPAIAAYGWQAGYLTLAMVSLAAAPLVWLGLRGAASANGDSPKLVETGLTPTEARRTPRFWLLTLAALTMALGVAGLVVHFVPILIDIAITPARAAGIASIIGLTSILGRLSVGYLLDRLPSGFVASTVLLLNAIGLGALMMFGAPAAPVTAALLGLAAGAEVDLLAFLTARYFGQRSYGAIWGWQFGVFTLGYGLSAYMIGRLRDETGGYGGAMAVCIFAMAIAAAIILVVSRSTGAGERYASEQRMRGKPHLT